MSLESFNKLAARVLSGLKSLAKTLLLVYYTLLNLLPTKKITQVFTKLIYFTKLVNFQFVRAILLNIF